MGALDRGVRSGGFGRRSNMNQADSTERLRYVGVANELMKLALDVPFAFVISTAFEGGWMGRLEADTPAGTLLMHWRGEDWREVIERAIADVLTL